MSMSAAIGNFMRWSERRARHERLHENDDTTVNVEENHGQHHRHHDLYLSSSSSSSSVGRGDASSSARAPGAGVARRVGSLQSNNNNTNAQQEGMNRSTTAGGMSTGGDNGAAVSSDQNTINVVQGENNSNADRRDEEEEGGEEGDATASAATAAATESNADNDGDSGTNTTETNGNSGRLERLLNHQRLLELEEERELTRRRTSTCILIAVFVLFRLWIEALIDGDPGLLILCLVGTTWTARWIRTNREREEELDRRIEEFVRTQGGAGSGGSEEALGGENRERLMLGTDGGRSDLTLSFQAQLALAIIESQRQMMVNGGFGHPDGHGNARERGVSEEARSRWTRYEYHDASSSLTSSSLMAKQHGDSGGGGGHGSLNRGSLTRRRDGYGSVASTDLVVDTEDKQQLSTDMDDEEQGGIVRPDSILPSSPHEEGPRSSDVVVKIGVEDEKDHHDDLSHGAPACSICLGEYEEGEPLVQLPCGHVYHEECVTAWTSNHIRCPLCNFDLENGEVPTNDTMATAASVSGTTARGDSIV